MSNLSESYFGECGDFLADLPRYLQHVGEKTSPHSPLPEHTRSCTRCQNNLHTARDIAGAFHGIRTRITSNVDRSQLRNVEKAVSIALSENRHELSNLFIEIGRTYLNDAANENGLIANLTPLQDPRQNLLRSVSLANDSVLMATEKEQMREWDGIRENLVASRIPQDKERLLQEAVRFFTTAQRITPRNERAAIHVGLAKIQQNQQEEALASYLWVIQEGHSIRRVAEAHINASYCLADAKKFHQAKEHAKTATRLFPEEPTAFNNWAVYSLLSGDRKESFSAWEQLEEEGEANPGRRERVQQVLEISLGQSKPFRAFLEKESLLRKELANRFPKTFSSAFYNNLGDV